jgi:hypothetical protein
VKHNFLLKALQSPSTVMLQVTSIRDFSAIQEILKDQLTTNRMGFPGCITSRASNFLSKTPGRNRLSVKAFQ